MALASSSAVEKEHISQQPSNVRIDEEDESDKIERSKNLLHKQKEKEKAETLNESAKKKKKK